MSLACLDLFAGAGGWDVAAQALGIDPLGIETDDAACATREAAGLQTVQADVAELDPSDYAPCALLLASPPCQAFSRAGKREGIEDLPHVYEAALALAEGRDAGEVEWLDERASLVTEPLRWALALEPTYMAWEQVPDVLPFWRYCSGLLEPAGWWTWVGICESERFGVPQTRERAILLASREGPVHPPRPTHQRYVKGEPQRHEVTMEGEILPWRSMAEALGWCEDRSVSTYGEDANAPNFDPSNRPARTVCGARAPRWVYRNGNQENAAERAEDEPAPTVHFGHRSNKVEWIGDRPSPTIVTTRRSDKGLLVGRQLPEGEGRNVGGRNWGGDGPQPDECPATTVAGDPRLSSRTHHNDGEQNAHAIRVSLEEAAILQGFPPDFPFRGSRTARFAQVGNAVPPLLAHAILSALLTPALQAQTPHTQEGELTT